jgi:hypothetical protein
MTFDPTQLPAWFLVFLVFVLGAYFAWSLPRHFGSLKDGLESVEKKFDRMISVLFEDGKDRERRLAHLEGEHRANMASKQSGGTRWSDSQERP